jgi:glycerophosphoryl diester phosphodiesterase
MLAIELGADGVELDVQLSADGEPVVIHDRRVDRTSNATGYVSEFNASELTSLDAGWGFARRLKTRPRLRARISRLTGADSEAYKRIRQPIPRLASVLEELSKTDLTRIYVEIKGSGPSRTALLGRTLFTLRQFDLQEVVTLLSFDHSIVGQAKREAPGVRAAITIPGSVKRLPTARAITGAAEAVGADEVALHYSIASPRIVDALHQRSLQVSAWTVNRKMIMKRVLALGVDSIMTNHVDRLKAVIQGNAGAASNRGRESVQDKRG